MNSRSWPAVLRKLREMATGSYLLWYPVKSRRVTDGLARHVAAIAETSKPAGKCLRLEFCVAPQEAGGPLTSTGLLIVNPPWTLAGELRAILPELEKPLGQGGAGRFRLETPKPLRRCIGRKVRLSRSQFAGNRIMLRLLGLALRSASANGCGGVTRPKKIQADRWRDPVGSGGQASGSECPVGRYATCA